MANSPDITKLKTSWTKYDAVQVIDIIGTADLQSYIDGTKEINTAILKSYLGLKEITDPIPTYWQNLIRSYPKQRKLFTLLAGIFTHHENIKDFAETYSTSNMGGVFKIGDGGKHQTNIRSALVEGGAALTSYRRKLEVPYDFSKIFEEDNIGSLFKEVITERLVRIGFSPDELKKDFYEICYNYDFHKALGLNKLQFKNWLEGKSIFKLKNFSYDLKDFKQSYQTIPTLKVDQWLNEWDSVNFDMPMRSKPDGYFLIFKIDIRLLKRMSDVHRRKTKTSNSLDANVQRSLKEERTLEIKNYVQKGFPLSTLSDKERNSEDNQVLKMPGFLTTSILINILGKDQKRGNAIIHDNDLIRIEFKNNTPELIIPDSVFLDDWLPELKPIEVIDGQHRLWAFDETENIEGKYEVPVVAYCNLDRAWQAYLFYVINIKPKKINTSLGYDLYPLLRTQEWLENSKEGLKVYRETRAQEIVEALWSFEESPWHKRISMLGDEASNVSQNAYVRALSDSFFKKVKRDVSGLFGDVLKKKNSEELKWVRAQQAGFLILIWDEIAKALSTENTKEGDLVWVDKIRAEITQLSIFEKDLELDRSFVSKNSNLSRDQGVTGVLAFANDFFYVLANESNLDFNEFEWDRDIDERQIDATSIDWAIDKFKNHELYNYVQAFANEVIKLDWRTSAAEFDDENERDLQKKYRGSGGYREIRNDLLKVFLASSNDGINKYASILSKSTNT
jgi:DGQHR domain-containing protein